MSLLIFTSTAMRHSFGLFLSSESHGLLAADGLSWFSQISSDSIYARGALGL